MIGKVRIGKSFGGCIAYCLRAQKVRGENEAAGCHTESVGLLCSHLCFGSAKELAAQFRDVSALRPRLARPVLHLVLSLPPGERLGEHALRRVVEACARDFGFEGNQYLAVEHRDTHHQHLHMVVNRVGFDGGVVSDSNSYGRVAQFCRKMEREWALRPVLSPRRFLSKEQRSLPRSDHRKAHLQHCLQTALGTAGTYLQFEARMQALGYRVERGRGIAFIDDQGVRTKGSEVGYPWGRIEGVLRQQALQKPTLAAPGTQAARLPTGDGLAGAKEVLHALVRHQEQDLPVPREWLPKKKGKKRKPSI